MVAHPVDKSGVPTTCQSCWPSGDTEALNSTQLTTAPSGFWSGWGMVSKDTGTAMLSPAQLRGLGTNLEEWTVWMNLKVRFCSAAEVGLLDKSHVLFLLHMSAQVCSQGEQHVETCLVLKGQLPRASQVPSDKCPILHWISPSLNWHPLDASVHALPHIILQTVLEGKHHFPRFAYSHTSHAHLAIAAAEVLSCTYPFVDCFSH